MRYLFLIIIVLPIVGFSQSSVITWSDTVKLSWEDYRIRKAKGKVSAVSFVSIDYKYEQKGSKLYVYIYSKFFPSKSWAIPNASNNLLDHEQTHFDIVELHSRKFRKLIHEANLKPKNAHKKIEKLFKVILDEKNHCQEQYDKETNFSENKEKQKEWTDKINEELKKLNSYSTTDIIKNF